MKKIASFLFSMFFSVVLLLAFAFSIAYATFIENDYGTPVAQTLIYRAWWFELLLLVGVVNLSGSVFKYNLVTRKKWAILLFHLAFILIILGAGVTRYFGFEGSMHIREGESNNQVVSEETYISLKAASNGTEVNANKKVSFTPFTSNDYKQTITVAGKEITVENEMFVQNAVETIVPDANGVAYLTLVFNSGNRNDKSVVLAQNQKKNVAGVTVGFETGQGSANIVFSQAGGLNFVCSDSIMVASMMGNTGEKVAPGTPIAVQNNTLYKLGSSIFVLKSYIAKGTPSLVQETDESKTDGTVNAFTAKITSGNDVRRVNVFEKDGEVSEPATCSINGVDLAISYGSVVRNLPFSIQLRDFQLERYPGSMSPSSYASEITLKDPASGVERPFRIFMNNILKYQGYRFFQSSFDRDEKGTILSVNHDYWGTFISYLGYFLMALGMAFTVFSKSSRFQTLVKLSSKLQAKRKGLKIALLVLALTGFGASQNVFSAGNSAAKNKHIDEFSRLLVQDHQGRIEPVSTLASDLLRKIAKANEWEGMSSVEFFMDMSANPDKWKSVPLVKISNTELAKMIGVSGSFASFRQMFDDAGTYKLNELVQKAYNKKQTMRNKFDKEIMNVDERVNICYEIFNGDFLKIFPVPNDANKTWATPAALPKTMKKEESDFAGNILNLYYQSYNEAQTSGNWSKPEEYLGYIKKFQKTYGADIMPSEAKIGMEIKYNEWNIFGKLAKIYAFLGFVLLVMHFMLIFKPSGKIAKYIPVGTWVIFAAFMAYTAGLLMRWYISGHAPWSNGYETMIYVGWATSLSGFVFVKRSPITLAVTTLLAAIILFVAGMSWMNPEITNLVPVLKSYWLVVHVAIITASYGFLAMGALLGMLNLILMILRNKQNNENISYTILEVSYIVEMALIIGLFMLTVGSFIGGVWANESWGRYWGWDPKETWALVTVLVYSIILHLRKVPGMKSTFALNSLALLGISTVLMTFFGVNYYLSGMHSYGAGDPPPIPSGLYVAIVVVFGVIAAAWYAENKNGNIADPEDPEE
jgi:ABC-type transport system involved in cytochrome c biogenesis, permease component